MSILTRLPVACGRPLILPLARATIMRGGLGDSRTLEALQAKEEFLRDMAMLTAVWGVGLLAETVAACILLYSMPMEEFLLVNPVVGYGTIGALVLWSLWAMRRWR